MKKQTTSIKAVAIVSCAAFLCATFPEQARAQCVTSYFNPAIQSSAGCSCTFPLGSCSPSVVIIGHAGYYSCVSGAGYSSCLTVNPNAQPYDYYDSIPCQNETSYTGYLECGLAVIAAGGVDAGVVVSACVVGGVFTLGAGCVAAIATITATAGLTIYICRVCNLAPCTDPTSASTETDVVPNGPDTNSGACPPA